MAFGFIRNILGGTDRHHNAIIACEDGVMRLEIDPIILAGFVTDPHKKGARHLIKKFDLPMQGLTGEVSIYTERNTIPFNPFVTFKTGEKEKLTNTREMAKEAFMRAKIEALNESRNNLIGLGLIITACVMAFSVLAIMGMTLLKTGQLHL
jgi:hypothetical protein